MRLAYLKAVEGKHGRWVAWAGFQPLQGENPVMETTEPIWCGIGTDRGDAEEQVVAEVTMLHGEVVWRRSEGVN